MNQHSRPSSNKMHRRSLSNYRPADYRSNSNHSENEGRQGQNQGRRTNRRRTSNDTKPEASPRAYQLDEEWRIDESVDNGEPDEKVSPSDQANDPVSGQDRSADLSSLWGDSDDEPATQQRRPKINPNAAWRATLSELALQLPAANFDTWIRDSHLIAYEDGEFVIGLPNAYARDWVENRLRNQIKRTLRSIVGREVAVTFRVSSNPVSNNNDVDELPLYATQYEESGGARVEPDFVDNRAEADEQELASLLEDVSIDDVSVDDISVDGVSANNVSADNASVKNTIVGKPKPTPRPAQQNGKAPYYSSQLNAHHTFESFVVGNHNRLAHAAAEAIANKPGFSFNPLFIYGGVGLGKTHLLHAIGNLAQANGFHTLYCSSEQFTNELISAIRSQSTEEFRNKYRQVDVLLIDDIQFIGGKESTQEEFFHTFNHLQASGAQVVLSSDRPPKALATLEERLRSRFEGGLQTDISQPDFETRVAILQSKASRMGVSISQEVLMLVAERVDSNIRELEGALNQLSMQAQLSGSTLTHSLALGILDNLAPSRTPCSPPMVIQIAADYHGLTVDDLKGRRRTSEIAGARQIAMFLLRTENDLSLPAIGALLGGRDHTTVRYGVDKIKTALESDEMLKQVIGELRQKVYTPYIG